MWQKPKDSKDEQEHTKTWERTDPFLPVLRENQPRLHLDLNVVASRCVRQYTSVV